MQVKSVKTGSVFWAACTSLSYFYMVSKIRNKHFVCEELYVVFLVDLVSQESHRTEIMIILLTEHFTLLERETIDSDCCWLCYKNIAVLRYCGSILCWRQLLSASSHTQNVPVVLLRKAGKESWPNFFKFQSMSILAIHATDPQMTGISFNG